MNRASANVEKRKSGRFDFETWLTKFCTLKPSLFHKFQEFLELFQIVPLGMVEWTYAIFQKRFP